MNILALGDSFTYGEELEDKNHAWPSVLANMLAATVDNRGMPAGGRRQVVANAITSILSYDLVVIGWPSPGRIEFGDEGGVFDIWPGMTAGFVTNSTPWRKSLVDYYTRHHSDDYILQQFLIDVILLQNFIKQHNIKCVMTMTRTPQKNHYINVANTANQQLMAAVDWGMFIDGQQGGMDLWTTGVACGPGGHFLTDGHLLIANKFYEHIRH